MDDSCREKGLILSQTVQKLRESHNEFIELCRQDIGLLPLNSSECLEMQNELGKIYQKLAVQASKKLNHEKSIDFSRKAISNISEPCLRKAAVETLVTNLLNYSSILSSRAIETLATNLLNYSSILSSKNGLEKSYNLLLEAKKLFSELDVNSKLKEVLPQTIKSILDSFIIIGANFIIDQKQYQAGLEILYKALDIVDEDDSYNREIQLYIVKGVIISAEELIEKGQLNDVINILNNAFNKPLSQNSNNKLLNKFSALVYKFLEPTTPSYVVNLVREILELLDSHILLKKFLSNNLAMVINDYTVQQFEKNPEQNVREIFALFRISFLLLTDPREKQKKWIIQNNLAASLNSMAEHFRKRADEVAKVWLGDKLLETNKEILEKILSQEKLLKISLAFSEKAQHIVQSSVLRNKIIADYVYTCDVLANMLFYRGELKQANKALNKGIDLIDEVNSSAIILQLKSSKIKFLLFDLNLIDKKACTLSQCEQMYDVCYEELIQLEDYVCKSSLFPLKQHLLQFLAIKYRLMGKYQYCIDVLEKIRAIPSYNRSWVEEYTKTAYASWVWGLERNKLKESVLVIYNSLNVIRDEDLRLEIKKYVDKLISNKFSKDQEFLLKISREIEEVGQGYIMRQLIELHNQKKYYFSDHLDILLQEAFTNTCDYPDDGKGRISPFVQEASKDNLAFDLMQNAKDLIHIDKFEEAYLVAISVLNLPTSDTMTCQKQEVSNYIAYGFYLKSCELKEACDFLKYLKYLAWATELSSGEQKISFGAKLKESCKLYKEKCFIKTDLNSLKLYNDFVTDPYLTLDIKNLFFLEQFSLLSNYADIFLKVGQKSKAADDVLTMLHSLIICAVSKEVKNQIQEKFASFLQSVSSKDLFDDSSKIQEFLSQIPETSENDKESISYADQTESVHLNLLAEDTGVID